jgi:hypothetical protein
MAGPPAKITRRTARRRAVNALPAAGFVTMDRWLTFRGAL